MVETIYVTNSSDLRVVRDVLQGDNRGTLFTINNALGHKRRSQTLEAAVCVN
jgi:hypothetical protein